MLQCSQVLSSQLRSLCCSRTHLGCGHAYKAQLWDHASSASSWTPRCPYLKEKANRHKVRICLVYRAPVWKTIERCSKRTENWFQYVPMGSNGPFFRKFLSQYFRGLCFGLRGLHSVKTLSRTELVSALAKLLQAFANEKCAKCFATTWFPFAKALSSTCNMGSFGRCSTI